jgi:hypothetical protein
MTGARLYLIGNENDISRLRSEAAVALTRCPPFRDPLQGLAAPITAPPLLNAA